MAKRLADEPLRGADEMTATKLGSTEDYRLATNVLAALAGHLATGPWEYDAYGAYDPSGRSWWIRFRRKAGRHG